MGPLKRLMDEELSPGSPEHALAELVRATPRSQRTSFQKERILARVMAAPAPARRRVGAVAAAVLVLSVGALAAAAIGRPWLSKALAPAPSATSSAVSPVVASGPSPAALIASPPPDEPSSPGQALTDRPSSAIAARPSHDTQGARMKSDGRLLESRRADGEDPGPVLEAIRDLRSRGDATRASALLAEYLRAHPRSVLSEDALALSIEAATARHDSHAAAALGRRYLDQFPNGRYRAFAWQAVRPVQP